MASRPPALSLARPLVGRRSPVEQRESRLATDDLRLFGMSFAAGFLFLTIFLA